LTNNDSNSGKTSRRIILLSGPVSSGKTHLSKRLEDHFGLLILRTRELLVEKSPKHSDDRLALQAVGGQFDRETDGKWVLSALMEIINSPSISKLVVVDCVRTNKQIEHIRNAYRSGVTHVHLTAPVEVLRRRYNQRYARASAPSYDRVMSNKTESSVWKLAETADIVIDSKQCNPDDVLVRAASYTSLYGESDDGYVDVIVGGQYGSEGKGQIASFIAREYDLLVRVGGPNAGHKVFELPEPYTHHHLPSGTRTSNAKLLLAPGSVLLLDRLLQEIADCKVDKDRLGIDPQAIVITPEDIDREGDVQRLIGSTRQGVGEASARKITHRGRPVTLAGNVPELKPFIRPAYSVISLAFANNEKILLEGTQGSGLSLHHGQYPYVTSRDTSVSGCLSEAGIPPSRVRRVIMVCRTYPIRVQDPVGGTSGPMSIEINLKKISERSGINLKELQGIEITSTTHRKRRIGEFDWVLLRKSALLNGPTDIALTFTDYLDKRNRNARRIEQLTRPTLDLIEEIERVTHARASLIATGFNNRSVIDRRSW